MEARKSKIIVIILAVALLIFEFNAMDYSRFWHWRNIPGVLVPLLIIVVMAVSIRYINKKRNNPNS